MPNTLELVIETIDGPASLGYLSEGDAGIRETVAAMARVAAEASNSPEVIGAAKFIAAGAITREGSRDDEFLLGLDSWFRQYMRYVDDPTTQELIRSPRALLNTWKAQGWMGGDCDDLATLGCSILMAVGFRPVVCVVSLTPKSAGGKFHHTFYGVVRDPRKPVTLATAVSNVIPFDPQERREPGVWPDYPRIGVYAIPEVRG